jgi:hypothetical protein
MIEIGGSRSSSGWGISIGKNPLQEQIIKRKEEISVNPRNLWAFFAGN